MVDLTVTITDENGESLGSVTIYEDGSDAEATTRIIQWINEEFTVDETSPIRSPLPLGWSDEPGFEEYVEHHGKDA